MLNWQDPLVQLLSARASIFVIYITLGWYTWEIITTCRFDWEYVTRRRKLRWTSALYLVSRYSVWIGFWPAVRVTNVFNLMSDAECTRWWKGVYTTAHLSVSTASLLLVIRVIAICEHNRWITAFLTAAWLAELGTLIHGIVQIEGIFVYPLYSCGVVHSVTSRLNMLVSFGLTLSCLGIALIALLRTPSAGIWKVLVAQGVVHLAVAIVAYLCTAVLLILNLNDGMNLGLQPASLVALVIVTNRMYRGLVQYGTSQADTFTMTSTAIRWTDPRMAPEHTVTIPTRSTATAVRLGGGDSGAGSDNAGIVALSDPEFKREVEEV